MKDVVRLKESYRAWLAESPETADGYRQPKRCKDCVQSPGHWQVLVSPWSKTFSRPWRDAGKSIMLKTIGQSICQSHCSWSAVMHLMLCVASLRMTAHQRCKLHIALPLFISMRSEFRSSVALWVCGAMRTVATVRQKRPWPLTRKHEANFHIAFGLNTTVVCSTLQEHDWQTDWPTVFSVMFKMIGWCFSRITYSRMTTLFVFCLYFFFKNLFIFCY